MIEAEHKIQIDANIDTVWDYVQDIRKWANLFPGCRECDVINEQDSHWTIKVGAGGLVKTVNVLVHVDQWNGPEKVNFTYSLKSEPVKGHGSYTASSVGPSETDIALKLHVEGSGQMAPMWEAMCKPLLPQLAKSFGSKLKAEIEGVAVTTPQDTGILGSIAQWLRSLWRALFGSKK